MKTFILVWLLFFSVFAEKKAADKLKMIDGESLRLTQAVIGFDEVERKQKKIRELDEKEREKYFIHNEIPVVIAPDLKYYMIDHHHFLAAALKEGYKRVYFRIEADLSQLKTMDAFWKEMEAKKWVYLKKDGVKIEAKNLPQNIYGLQDDPYRTLAANVRDTGAYKDTNIPFSEFAWADYFRNRVPLVVIKKNKEKAIKMGQYFSCLSEASVLPGYIKNPTCSKHYED